MASTTTTNVSDADSCNWKDYFEMTASMISLPSSESTTSTAPSESESASSSLAQEQAARQSVGTTRNVESYYFSHYAVAGVAIIGVIIMLLMLITSRKRRKSKAASTPSTAGGGEGFEATFDDFQSRIDFDAPTVHISKTKLDTWEDFETNNNFSGNGWVGNRENHHSNGHGRRQVRIFNDEDQETKASTYTHQPISINMFLLVSTSWYLFWFGISHFLRGMIVDIVKAADDVDYTWMIRLYYVSLMFYLPGLILLASELEIFQLSSASSSPSASLASKTTISNISNGNKKVIHFLIYAIFVIGGIVIDLLLPALTDSSIDMFLTGFIVVITYVIVSVTALSVVTYDIFSNCCGCSSEDHESRMTLLSSAKDNLLFALCLILFFIGSMMVKIVLLPVCSINSEDGSGLEEEDEYTNISFSSDCSIFISANDECPVLQDGGITMIMLISNILEGVGCISLITIVTMYMIA